MRFTKIVNLFKLWLLIHFKKTVAERLAFIIIDSIYHPIKTICCTTNYRILYLQCKTKQRSKTN